MTAIVKGSSSICENSEGTLYQDWMKSVIPYAKSQGAKPASGVDVYHLTFKFRKIHIDDLSKGRYKLTFREHDDEFVKIHHDVGESVLDCLCWGTADETTKPYTRISYIVANDSERKHIEDFLDNYLDHCDDAERKFERACFDANSSWAKEQPWHSFISKPQLMVIHKMDYSLGRFKKPWRDPYGKNARIGKRYSAGKN